jgi:hypothetical protein
MGISEMCAKCLKVIIIGFKAFGKGRDWDRLKPEFLILESLPDPEHPARTNGKSFAGAGKGRFNRPGIKTKARLAANRA